MIQQAAEAALIHTTLLQTTAMSGKSCQYSEKYPSERRNVLYEASIRGVKPQDVRVLPFDAALYDVWGKEGT